MGKHRAIDAEGEYFRFDVNTAMEIVLNGGGVDEVLCFLLLCRGAGASDKTGWAHRAAAKHLGITTKKVQSSFEWLVQHEFVKETEHDFSVPLNNIYKAIKKGAKLNFPMRWEILAANAEFFIPNSLIGKSDEARPLYDLYHSPGERANGLAPNQRRLLQLMLLLRLYAEHDLEDHGGVPAHLWAREWPMIDDGEPGRVDFPKGGFLARVKKGRATSKTELIDWLQQGRILPLENAELHLKCAWKNLFDHRLVYESLYVWEVHKPTETARISYALIPREEWARIKYENFLADDISSMCEAVQLKCDLSAFKHDKKFYDGRKYIFTYVGFGENFLVQGTAVLAHLPQSLDHKVSRDSIGIRTTNCRLHLPSMIRSWEDDDEDWFDY